MYAPINWLKEYVDISLPVKELAWRLTELGLGVEKTIQIEGEDVFELEITPNRPDLLSIVGISREIAAIEKKKIKFNLSELPAPKKKLSIKINNDFKLFPRYTGIIIDHVKIAPSPEWMQKRLKQLCLRPINNIVDITNYVMFETGIPLHAFDYDQIKGQEINVIKSEGGEEFISVDEKSYRLPKNAIIIKDRERIIDLCGIKGGLNSGITDKTTKVYLQVTADDPLLIRRTSHALALRSDASAIFERGVDKGSLLQTLKRAANLIIELGGEEIASDIIDLKENEFNPWKLDLNLARLEKVLGIPIPEEEVIEILDSLSLSPVKGGKEGKDPGSTDLIKVTVPTYRQDLKIEEDLIEEVARVYGYNRFTPTFINSSIPTKEISYFKNYSFEEKVKNIISGCGYSEVYTYSLVSGSQLAKLNQLDKAIKLTNPVSLDYKYLRPTLKGNLLTSLKLNIPNFDTINIFELGRVYMGKPPHTEEPYHLGLIRSDGNYEKIKGAIEEMLQRLGIDTVKIIPSGYISSRVQIGDIKIGTMEIIETRDANNFEIKNPPVYAELNFTEIEKLTKRVHFAPVSSYPATIEDIAFILKSQTYLGELIDAIKSLSPIVSRVDLLDSYENTRTLRIYYLDKTKTLTQKDTQPLREKIISLAETKFGAKLKI